MKTRALKTSEVEVLASVFLYTLPYDEIAITDQGPSDSEWYGARYNLIGPYRYHINVGEADYDKDLATSNTLRRSIVHEATHIWQFVHQRGSFLGVYLDSLSCQGVSLISTGNTDSAYDYELGKDWDDYHAEQQAQIVEDWYRSDGEDDHKGDNMSVASSRWHYIRDIIREPGFGGKAYFFKPKQYLRYTIGESTDRGYPKLIAEEWNDFVEGSKASFNKLNGKTEQYYFFKGDQYIRWTRDSGVDSGYPKKVTDTDTWNNSFLIDVNAAINYDNGSIYFFKGEYYIKWILGVGAESTPIKISEKWDSFMSKGIDAAINWGNGKAYFFKGDEYIRYTIGVGKDSGYPKKIVESWPLFFQGGLRSALLKRNKLY